MAAADRTRPAGAGGAADAAIARREVLLTLGRALWRFRWRTLAALGLLVAAKLLMVLVPLTLKHIVDALSQPAAMLALPVFLLAGYALLRFGGGLFTELRDMAFARVTQTTVAEFTLRMFGHLHSLGIPFHVNRQTGALSRDVERGTAGVGFLLSAALFTVLPTLIEIVAVVAILLAGYNLIFSWIVAATFIAYGVFTAYFTEKRIFYQRALNELDSQANGQLVDSLLNYETVKYYTGARHESDRLHGILRRWIDVGMDNQRALSRLHVGQSGVIAFGVAALMLLAGQEVVQGRMTVGDLVLVNAYMIQICLPLNTLGLVFRQSREALINAERMAGLLRFRPEADPAHPLPPLQLKAGEVVFSQVGFGYEPGRPILHEIDFRIEPGQTVAVVGGSGSGKSTLARLLLRLHDVDAGSISIDGQDIRSVSQDSLRSAIGIVPQDTPLFNDTIAYNIGYGRRDATRQEVEEAARAACVHDFIQSLPAQYDTVVGERGVRLSGGERQRIAIARTLLKNPSLLIFDEATSALDTRTERSIQAQLDEMARDRSTFVIAHRLSTIVGADQILVMEQGRIVERGGHEQLLRLNQLYARMWNLQRQQDRLQEEGSRLSAQPVNMVTLAAGVIDAIRPLADEKGVHLYTLIGNEAMRVTADPGVLQQVAWELCINAIAVTPRGGRMALRLERADAVVRLAILDGRPAPDEAARQAGDDAMPPAVGAHVPPDPDRLAAWAEQMGGTFFMEASGEGAGMAFGLEMPVRAVASMLPASPLDAALENSLDGLRIYLVDDQPEALALVADVLRDHGAKVTAFACGGAVLAALEEKEAAQWPDVLLCDISLEDMEGYAVIERVRQIEAGRRVALGRRLPAVALSGYTGQEDRLRAMLAGFQAYLGKPADTRELVATARAVTRGAMAHLP